MIYTTIREFLAKHKLLRRVNSRLPTTNAQPFPFPNAQSFTTSLQLGIGRWEWLGVGGWALGVDPLQREAYSVPERERDAIPTESARRGDGHRRERPCCRLTTRSRASSTSRSRSPSKA